MILRIRSRFNDQMKFLNEPNNRKNENPSTKRADIKKGQGGEFRVCPFR